MMADLITRAAVVMLARTLHVPVEKVKHLESLGAENVDAIRHRMANTLYDEHAEVFKRISALVPIVPLKIALPIVQKTVPATMAGRAAGAVGLAHPKKASSALALLQVDYAADAAPYIDPRAVVKLAPVIDDHAPVVAIAREVLRRKDYITAAQFVEAATPELIRAVEQGIDDNEGLMRAGAFVHNGAIISDILRVIVESNPARVSDIIQAAAEGPTDLRLDALSVLFRIDADLISTVGDVMFAETDPLVLADLFKSYLDEGAAPELLTFAGHLSPSALDSLATNPVIEDDDVLFAVIRTAVAERNPDVWRGMLDVAERTAPGVQSRAVRMLTDIDVSEFDGVAALATEHGLWPSVLRLAAGQEPDLQAQMASRFQATVTDADRACTHEHAAALGLTEQVAPLLASLAARD